MNKLDKIIAFIDQHKYGILVTLALHVGLFLYLQISTYKEAVLFEPWDFRTRNEEAPDNIILTPEQIEMNKDFTFQEEVSSQVKNENDSRERSLDHQQSYTSYDNFENAEAIEDEYEDQVKERIRKEREKEQASQSTALEPEKKSPKKEIKPLKFGQSSSDKAVGGQTMVSYNLQGRTPYNNNDWYIRNPGYTCGNVNGVVKVEITVDKGGKVIDAKILSAQSSNANPCMQEKALSYALQSKFNYAGNAQDKQKGCITYRFVYKN